MGSGKLRDAVNVDLSGSGSKSKGMAKDVNISAMRRASNTLIVHLSQRTISRKKWVQV